MAEVKVREIVDDLRSEFKRALESTLEEVLPGTQFDRDELFRAFSRAVGRKTSTWSRVSDHYVDMKVRCRHCGERT